ncbi:MAG: IS3 family transposase, partial [Opitutales bacterium]
MADSVQAALGCSGRAVSRWLSFCRSSLRYQPKPVADKQRRREGEIVRMSKKHPTLGYKKITAKLREAGWRVSKKQVQRVRREEG